ncbi:esterase-5B-like [Haematobia irritans]|uniref:esterase-5B-like n=1 Tax=Haematobia irritans TaxID=7368 RepID=UPI003F507A3E
MQRPFVVMIFGIILALGQIGVNCQTANGNQGGDGQAANNNGQNQSGNSAGIGQNAGNAQTQNGNSAGGAQNAGNAQDGNTQAQNGNSAGAAQNGSGSPPTGNVALRVPQTSNVVVQTANGPVRGQEWGMYYSWESIPYAEPPVGDLRFEDPQPYSQQWTQEFNATVFPQYCMQWWRDRGVNKRRGVEDCLNLSIYSPKPRGVKYPVVAYLHGGHFMLGGGPEFDAEPSMQGGRLIMVKINSRLGPLGYLSTGDDILSGNYGLKDQALALKWIKENIAAFGGDPEKILLLGQGSGAASAHMHMLRPSLASIAKAVVSMSGVALNPWAITTNAPDNAKRLAAAVNCTNTNTSQDIKACLKAAKPEDVVGAVQSLLNWGYNPFTTFGPVIESPNTPNAFLTEQPEAIIRSGAFSHIPWLASYTTNDGAFNAAELLRINSRTGTEFLNEMNDNWLDMAPENLFLKNLHDNPRDYAQSLKDIYIGKENFTVENYLEIQTMYTDVLMRLGVLKAMQLHSSYSKAPVYGYMYDIPANYGIGFDMSLRSEIKFGPSHMDDLTLILRPPSRSTPRPDEVVAGQKLLKMLADFADTGSLIYGTCNFEPNTKADNKSLKLLWITKDKCETILQDLN